MYIIRCDDMKEQVSEILGRVLDDASFQMSHEQAMVVYRGATLGEVCAVADAVRRRLHGDGVVTWQIDRNVNITNVCVSGCKFCNFHCKPHQKELSYVTDMETYRRKIDEMFALGGDQLLLQGGLHPDLGLEYYERLFSDLKREFPILKLNALGPVEVDHISRLSGVDSTEVLRRLIAAGLDSLPGAGAEILVSDVRRKISPGKCSAERWLEVMEQAHGLGIIGSATMMYGHVESLEDRVTHLIRIRELQGRTGGFRAFIAWAFQGAGTQLERRGVVPLSADGGAAEYVRLVAMSRLVLNNVPNIQASWLTMGVGAAQMALHGGANDMGSIMIEENVVSAAGATNWLDRQGMEQAIRQAGFRPALRDQQYKLR